ncbi:hypothetical protein SAMN05518854_11760 [Variovorax sp. YR266]|nr:hypothetical protein [Variovorax sp. YR266]SDZ71278.1 hypothetical protein SAMN05518854_11760 [Variovorax sp. YR266]
MRRTAYRPLQLRVSIAGLLAMLPALAVVLIAVLLGRALALAGLL